MFQEFLAWGQYLPGIAQAGLDEHARLETHITTGYGTNQ